MYIYHNLIINLLDGYLGGLYFFTAVNSASSMDICVQLFL